MSINKVILVGNVGKDPEVKYFDSDTAVANFPLATTDRAYTTRNGTEVPERTEWHNIVAWRGLAKLAENYIKKGTQLYIEGKLRTRSWDDQNGQKRYTTEIMADVIQLLGRKADNPGADGPANTATPGATPQASPTQAAPQNTAMPTNQPDLSTNDSDDDDLPF